MQTKDARQFELDRLQTENARLRSALQEIIEHDQIGGYIPKDEHSRREQGFNIETYDGECAKIARRALDKQ